MCTVYFTQCASLKVQSPAQQSTYNVYVEVLEHTEVNGILHYSRTQV